MMKMVLFLLQTRVVCMLQNRLCNKCVTTNVLGAFILIIKEPVVIPLLSNEYKIEMLQTFFADRCFKKKMTFLMTDFITDPLVMVKPRTKMIITER